MKESLTLFHNVVVYPTTALPQFLSSDINSQIFYFSLFCFFLGQQTFPMLDYSYRTAHISFFVFEPLFVFLHYLVDSVSRTSLASLEMETDMILEPNCSHTLATRRQIFEAQPLLLNLFVIVLLIHSMNSSSPKFSGFVADCCMSLCAGCQLTC